MRKPHNLPSSGQILSNPLLIICTGHPHFQHGLLSTVSKIVKSSNAKADRVREQLLGADLPAKIISKVKRSSGDGGMDTSCVQLLVCRMSPMIWGLQVTLLSRHQTCNQSMTPCHLGRTLSGSWRVTPSHKTSKCGRRSSTRSCRMATTSKECSRPATKLSPSARSTSHSLLLSGDSQFK